MTHDLSLVPENSKELFTKALDIIDAAKINYFDENYKPYIESFTEVVLQLEKLGTINSIFDENLKLSSLVSDNPLSQAFAKILVDNGGDANIKADSNSSFYYTPTQEDGPLDTPPETTYTTEITTNDDAQKSSTHEVSGNIQHGSCCDII